MYDSKLAGITYTLYCLQVNQLSKHNTISGNLLNKQ